MALQILLIAIGVVLLYFGGEVLVRYSSMLARALRVSPVVIGLTVIAFGTSAPELATAVAAAIRNQPELVLGNVVGSNIANIGLILALTALVLPLPAEASFVRREVRFMILTAVLTLGLAATGGLFRWHAVLFMLLLVFFLRALMRDATEVLSEEAEKQVVAENLNVWICLLGSVAGLALLVLGANAMVTGAVELARQFGVSERVIGLTLVAFGTSVPELAGCLVAAYRRQTGLVFGNIVGSNIFNTLLILPSAVLIRPIHGALPVFSVDLLVMLAFSVSLWVFLKFFGGGRITRVEGMVLLLGYVVYIGSVVVRGG